MSENSANRPDTRVFSLEKQRKLFERFGDWTFNDYFVMLRLIFKTVYKQLGMPGQGRGRDRQRGEVPQELEGPAAMNFNSCGLLLASIRDANTAQSVLDVFNWT